MIKVYIEVEGGMVAEVWVRGQEDTEVQVVILDHDEEDYTHIAPNTLTDEDEEALNQKMGDWLEQEEAEDWDEEEGDDE